MQITLWKNENFHLTSLDKYFMKTATFSLTHFWQKFRENNVFTKEITIELI